MAWTAEMTVTSFVGGAALAGARIDWDDEYGSHDTFTAADGTATASLDDGAPGQINFTASKAGYQPQQLTGIDPEFAAAGSNILVFELYAAGAGGTSGGGPSKGCYIVSATSGSPDSLEVGKFRQLRARVAAESRLSAQLIDMISRDYYEFSPALAEDLERNALARMVALSITVRPLLAWYKLASALALDFTDGNAVAQAKRELLESCPHTSNGASILALLDTICSGDPLPEDVPAPFFVYWPKVKQAVGLPLARWALLDPLVRAWRSAIGETDCIEGVSEWLASAPLDAITPPSDEDVLDAELQVLAGFFDFRPTERLQIGRRLAAAWPSAIDALDLHGFIGC